MTTYDYANFTASGDARAWAKQMADQAFQQAQMQGMSGNLALDQAKFAWQKVMDTAGLTGKFEDNWTFPANQWFTSQFGEWMPNGPTAGQQTMAREQQTYEQQQGYGSLYGQYYAPGTAPSQGQQTLSAQDLAMRNALGAAGVTGYYVAPGSAAGAQGVQTLQGQNQQFQQGLQTQQEQRAAQAQGQSQAMQYLQLLSNLRGPADWAKYQQVLGSTPGGMRDLVGAAMGQYVPGGGATTGMAPQAVSLQSMMGDVSGNPYYGQGGGQLLTPNVYGQNSQGMYTQQYQPSQQTIAGYQQAATQAYQPQQQWAQPGGQISQEGMWGGPKSGAAWDQYSAAQQQRQAQMPQMQTQTSGGLGMGSFGAAQPAQMFSGQQPSQYQGGQPAQYQNEQWASGAYRGGTGGLGMGNMGGQTWGSGIGVGQQQPTPQQQQQGLGNGTNLPAPNQISAQGWKNMQPSQQQMLLGMYEAQGWDKGDVQSLYNQSLPKYATNSPTAGTWRM